MIAFNISRETLERAAEETGVEVDLSRLSGSGKRWRVKVNLRVPEEAYTPKGRRRRGQKGNAPYQRASASAFQSRDRRVHAVCWHGFRDFFRACFKHEPRAIFRTSLDTWRGSDDFEARFEGSATRNIGAPIDPVCIAEACFCERYTDAT